MGFIDDYDKHLVHYVRMTSCEPGFLVGSLKTTLHFRFLSMVRNYTVTRPPIAGCSSGSSIIFALGYGTQSPSLFQAALFPVPTNPERSTHICSHHSTISQLYNTKGSRYLMRLHLRRYANPFPSSWLHQLIVLVQLRCLDLLGTVANKGAECIARLLGGIEMGTHITTQ